MQPFDRHRQELRVIQKNEVNCSYVAENFDWKKIVAEKFIGQDRYFQPMLIGSESKTKNMYIV